MEQLKKYKKCNNIPGLENDNSQETISTGKYIQKCYDSKGNKTTTTESSSEKKDRIKIQNARNNLKELTDRILKRGGKKKSRKQKKTKRTNKKRRSTRRK